MKDVWEKIPNTFDYDNIDEQGGKNKDGAKLYVGWAKHAMFNQPNTAWNDEPSQGCEREYRSRDWWYVSYLTLSSPTLFRAVSKLGTRQVPPPALDLDTRWEGNF
jgi:hypothetical protein